MGLWKLEEARLRQNRGVISAADAETANLGFPGPPDGKCWIVTGAGYFPSVAETQVVSFHKLGQAGRQMGLLNPVSLALNTTQVATFVEQGMEVILFPGEYIVVRRAGHTAGSTMTAYMQFIEVDLPLYTYEEPQIVKKTAAVLSSIRSRLASSGGGPGRTSGGIGPGGLGGRGERGSVPY